MRRSPLASRENIKAEEASTHEMARLNKRVDLLRETYNSTSKQCTARLCRQQGGDRSKSTLLFKAL